MESNKRVQGTRHKVSGPLTPDVLRSDMRDKRRQGEAKGGGDGYSMKSDPTDDMMPRTIALPRNQGHPGFPRYGKLFGDFSTLWKIFFHSMENLRGFRPRQPGLL